MISSSHKKFLSHKPRFGGVFLWVETLPPLIFKNKANTGIPNGTLLLQNVLQRMRLYFFLYFSFAKNRVLGAKTSLKLLPIMPQIKTTSLSISSWLMRLFALTLAVLLVSCGGDSTPPPWIGNKLMGA